MSTSFQFGYRDGFQISLVNPWFAGTQRLNYNFSSRYTTQEDVKYESAQNHVFNVAAYLGKGFSQYTNLAIGYEYVSYELIDRPELSLSTKGKDQYSFVGIKYNYNTLDFIKFPRKGIAANITAKQAWSISHPNEIQFLKMEQYFASYFSINDETIYAINLINSNSFGDTPYYFSTQFGDTRLLRGNIEIEKSFGKHLFVFRHEFRYQFLKDYPVSLDLPLLGKFLKNMNTSMYTYLWEDLGQLYKEFEDIFTVSEYNAGYGLGFALIFPYVNRMSFEIGLSPNGSISTKFLLNAYF